MNQAGFSVLECTPEDLSGAIKHHIELVGRTVKAAGIPQIE